MTWREWCNLIWMETIPIKNLLGKFFILFHLWSSDCFILCCLVFLVELSILRSVKCVAIAKSAAHDKSFWHTWKIQRICTMRTKNFRSNSAYIHSKYDRENFPLSRHLKIVYVIWSARRSDTQNSDTEFTHYKNGSKYAMNLRRKWLAVSILVPIFQLHLSLGRGR